VYYDSIPAGAMAGTGLIQHMKFDLALLPNLVEYTKLFDQYRIRRMDVILTPMTNTDDTQNPALTFVSSIDLDGGGPVTTFDQIMQCTNARISTWSPGNTKPGKYMTLRPRCKNFVQGAKDPVTNLPTDAVGLNPPLQWLDLAYPDIPHFGLNLGWTSPNNTMTAVQMYSVRLVHYVEFRKVR
jgi:hypothetical protein